MNIDVFENLSTKGYLIDLINEAFDNFVRGEYRCPEFSDRDFTYLSLLRALSKVRTGREFIQDMNDYGESNVRRSNYFESLSSERRLSVFSQGTDALNKMLKRIVEDSGVDYLSDFPELKGRAVFAGDGHSIEHASHSKRRSSGKLVPETSIHLLDLHTGLGQYLTTVSGDGTHRHEMPSLRKALTSWLKNKPEQEKAPIIIYDPAGVDKQFWTKMATVKKNGIRVITKTKTNMVFTIRADSNFDSTLPINKGVVSYQLVGQNNAIAMHKIKYQNPEDGAEYEFLTTVNDLEPGLIAWLYLLRWKIEKMFDTFKNKMNEKKGWATGSVAQEIQARACNTAHNFLQVLKLIIKNLDAENL